MHLLFPPFSLWLFRIAQVNLSRMAGKSFCKFITSCLNKTVFKILHVMWGTVSGLWFDYTHVWYQRRSHITQLNLFNRNGVKIKVCIVSGLLSRENVFFHKTKERVIYHSNKLGKRRTFFPKQLQLCIWQAVVKAILLSFLASNKSVPGTD